QTVRLECDALRPTTLSPPIRVQSTLRAIATKLQELVYFLVSVLRKFRDNKGLLLASGVGYNTLLSVVPLFIVLLLVLSTFFDQQYLVEAINRELRFIVPGHADWLTESIAGIVEARNLAGTVVVGVLLFFSSIAFRTTAIRCSNGIPKPRRWSL
ncbi:MAG: YhjD/YihY/BrkB family envelope integrity protein, partial [Bradymonadaceae bacterium]